MKIQSLSRPAVRRLPCFRWLSALLLGLGLSGSLRAAATHSFALGRDEFLLDGQPFQIRAGEMHPNRIPREYWTHRLRLAKAMGLNTVAAYVFWNYHEVAEGRFDFETWNRDLPGFFRAAQAEGLWVFLRPGPYCCAEYDFGALPLYLLREQDLKLRGRDPRYLKAAERYLRALAKVIRPFQVNRGGPILLLQIENEYGSYGNDREYLRWLHDLWRKLGLDLPFTTGDGPTPYMLEAGSLPGCAVGLDSGSELSHWELANKMNPGVPVFSSETYPGWLTHWGEPWARVADKDIVKEVRFLLEHRKSFNLYMFAGGSNFGFTAGANADRLDASTNGIACSFMPDITSYDYDAPVGEQGNVTSKYHALRELMATHQPAGTTLPPVPAPIPAMSVPPITLAPLTTLWQQLPRATWIPQPRPFESLGQYQGLMLYRTRLVGHHNGRLILRDLHDYALVFLDGTFVGTIDRRLNQNAIMLPATAAPNPTLEILVEAMGHINFGEFIVDRKGITERAVLNGMTLMDWEVFGFPLDEKWVSALPASGTRLNRPGGFFRGTFELDQTADTFLDLAAYRKGYVWVNGHNLGRYWNLGPQQRLYCPASWLKRGVNEIRVLDLHLTDPAPIEGKPRLEG